MADIEKPGGEVRTVERNGVVYSIPDFVGDARSRSEYQAELERRRRSFVEDREAEVRRSFQAKREGLRRELAAAAMILEQRRVDADLALAAYRAAYPHRTKKDRAFRPSFFESIASFGKAGRLYRKATAAVDTMNGAASKQRRLEHADEQLDGEVQRAVGQAVAEAKAEIESEAWLAEQHGRAPLKRLKARLEEIDRERIAYGARLQLGEVSAEEMRDRFFAEHDVHPIDAPREGLMFFGYEEFQSLGYFVMRDLKKRLCALPYDERLESIVDGVFDVFTVGNTARIRLRVQEETKLPYTPLDHFHAVHDDINVPVREAYRKQRRAMRERAPGKPTAADLPIEDEIRNLLVEYAQNNPTPRAPDLR